tara:strand:+ start:18 stop:1049 length:1032 start_codon:yes stop_codon:yes gene_type:complete
MSNVVINPYSFAGVDERFMLTITAASFILKFRGNTDVEIDWDDGTIEIYVAASGADQSHTYSGSGTYQIKITGQISQIYNYQYSGLADIDSIDNWGSSAWTTFDYMFAGRGVAGISFDIIATDVPDLSGVTSMKRLFEKCTVTDTGGSVGDWDVSNVVNMEFFGYQADVSALSIGGWDVGQVTDFERSFSGGTGSFSDISDWDTSSALNMFNMMASNYVPDIDIGKWDVSNVTNMQQLLYKPSNPTGLFNQSLANWNIQNVTTMATMIVRQALSSNGALAQTNYGLTLIGWTGWSGGAATKTVQNNVPFYIGTTKCPSGGDAEDARDWLIDTKGWVITDGGLV